MKINSTNIHKSNIPAYFDVPAENIFKLHEKVLQFGTGVLLRGLPDFFIDKANKQNIFNGRIVVVKSTGLDVSEFSDQGALYTHCIKGIVEGKTVEENIINASISKVVSAKDNWKEVFAYAESKNMQIIISNTTEVGITLKPNDDIYAQPPESFPAKLLAFLYKRFQFFKATEESGMVIIPTELIVYNGNKLKDIIPKLASLNNLDKSFIDWIKTANDFCNSLVDRIVPGALNKQDQQVFEKLSGYSDALTIMSEPYSLWAIETSSPRTKEILSFYKADETIIITDDINKYRELKLRLLNGTHTFCCGLAYLKGFDFVNEAMRASSFNKFIKELMLNEIAPCIIGETINVIEANAFAEKVIDRFSNPFINHKWLSITMQYSAKMKMRNVPLLLEWYKQQNKTPQHMAAGFAAYILFMKPVIKNDNDFYGLRNNQEYKIDDDKALYFFDVWKLNDVKEVVTKVLSDKNLWDYNLTELPGFCQKVIEYLNEFSNQNFGN